MLDGLLGVKETKDEVALRFDCLEAAREFGRDFADYFVRRYGTDEASKFPLAGPEKKVLDYMEDILGVVELKREFLMFVPGDRYYDIEVYLKKKGVV